MAGNDGVRIAMWSGPRNISTAMMRAWENRGDTFVCDEPLYAYYLKSTGLPHPGADEIIARQENDWRKVADRLTGPIREGKPIFFQKHMTHHFLPNVGRDWLDDVTNCFLIRDPGEMLTSYLHIRDEPTTDDLGWQRQVEIFERTRERTGRVPPVLDARDVQNNPRELLAALCDAVGVAFTEKMLSWPPGRRETDGVWAPYWYSQVETSTGWRPYKAKDEQVPAHLEALHAQCRACYETLYAHRLQA